MKRRKQVVLFLLLAVMGAVSIFGKSRVTAFAETATETQTEVSDKQAADTEVTEYEGFAEAPGIIKYMIFSLIGVVVLAVIAGIYCAVTPPRRRK